MPPNGITAPLQRRFGLSCCSKGRGANLNHARHIGFEIGFRDLGRVGILLFETAQQIAQVGSVECVAANMHSPTQSAAVNRIQAFECVHAMAIVPIETMCPHWQVVAAHSSNLQHAVQCDHDSQGRNPDSVASMRNNLAIDILNLERLSLIDDSAQHRRGDRLAIGREPIPIRQDVQNDGAIKVQWL